MHVDGSDSSSHIDLTLAKDLVVVSDDSNVVPMMNLNHNIVSDPSSVAVSFDLIVVPLAVLGQNVDVVPFSIANFVYNIVVGASPVAGYWEGGGWLDIC